MSEKADIKMVLKFKLIFLFLLVFICCACSRGTKTPEQTLEVTKAESASLPQGASAITGQVLFEGKAPPATPLAVASFPECAMAHPKGVLSEDVLVKDGKLQNVFVYVKEGAKNFPPPTGPVTLDQKGCVYNPHVFGIQVGQPLLILNSDPMIHNIHALMGAETIFNVAMPVQGQKLTQTFSKPQVMTELKCDIHGWMKAYIGVLNHPFYSVADSSGRFEIKGLTPGDYTVAAWHERFGEKIQKITLGVKPNPVLHTLGEDETKYIQFNFTPQ